MTLHQEQKNMLRQQRAYNQSEDGLPQCQSHHTPEHQGKFKGKGFVDPKHGDHVTGKLKDKDELIKYMKNPPRYLQRRERVQGKVLSFGVLDWDRLENWKRAADGTNAADSTDVSSCGLISSSEDTAFDSSSNSSCISINSHCYGEERRSSFCSGVSAYHKDACFQEYESASQANMHYFDLLPTRFRKRLESDLKIGLEDGNCSSNMRSHNVSLDLRGKHSVTHAEAKKRMENRENLDVNKKKLDRTSVLCSSSANSSEEDIIITPNVQQKTSFKTNEKKRYGKQELDLSHQHQGRKPKDIVLQPSKYALTSHSEEHRASLDVNLVENVQNNFSAEFHCEKAHSGELGSRTPHSCPIVFSQQTDPRPETRSELLCETSKACQGNRQNMKGECSRSRSVEYRTENHVGNSSVLDQEMHKRTSSKGRHPSPNRRFSFSFSQIGRSFSFKESSFLSSSSSPPRISVKSGPLTSNASAYTQHSTTQVKGNGHNRTRSSPMRRILDPLLRSKSEILGPSKGVSSSSHMSPIRKSPQNVKQDTSTIRALLQFTVRNGIHLFQFVVDGENKTNGVLAATMKNLDSSTQFYTFYSFKEVKKKSGSWLGQGNKERNHGFAHKVVAHMRLHASCSSDFTTQRSESVLFDAETIQSDQCIQRGELAAVVDQTHLTTNSREYKVSESHSTAVIIPGGIHTPPKDGCVLSPLIDRWKSSGTCDCGGWDIGCKLRVLHNRFSKALKPHTSHASSIQFFDQERDRATFTLVSHADGFHSVEFDPSISLLQAFFISLTVINPHNSYIPWDASNVPETKVFQEPVVTGDGHMKRKPPVKYASNPPVSPVGRV